MRNNVYIPDKELNYQGYMVFVLTIIWSVAIVVVVSFGFVFLPQLWHRWLAFLSISLFIAITHFLLNHYKKTRFASLSLPIILWLFVTIPCYTSGGIFSPGIISQMSVILTAAFLLGWRGGLTFGLLSLATDLGFAILELNGHLPPPSVIHTPLTMWIGAIIPFGTLLALQYYATSHLRSGLLALQKEVKRREEAEKTADKTLNNLGERIKELKTLYSVSRILQSIDGFNEHTYFEIVELLPLALQFPDKAVARIYFDDVQYCSANYMDASVKLRAEAKTSKGKTVGIEIVYLHVNHEFGVAPFLKEERRLIDLLVEMIKTHIDQEVRKSELRDYQYALDVASGISISNTEGKFTYVNDNFCNLSKFSKKELLGQHRSIIWSGIHSTDYYAEIELAMQNGEPFKGEFCNKTKDGTIYWVDTTIIPFLDNKGRLYQYLAINYDITERKKATQLFDYQFNNSPDTILLVNRKLEIETLNRYSIDGIKTSVNDIIGKNAIEVLLPESREISKAALIKCFETGENQEFEIAASNNRWVQNRMIPIIEDGIINHVMIIATDNTKRRIAELELSKSEIKNKALIENISEGILLIDKDEKIVFQSPAVTKITGYTQGEINSQKTFQFIHPDDIGVFKESLKNVFYSPGIAYQVQFRIIHKNGHTIWLEGSILNMLENENIQGIVVNYRDITARKKDEAELIESKERYESIIKVSNTGAWEYHIDSDMVWYSPEYYSMLGIKNNDGNWFKSVNSIWIDRLHPEDKERSISDFNNFLTGNSEEIYENYFRMRHELGHWVWIWSRGRRLKNASGKLTDITLGTHIDISERVNAEEKTRKSEELLKKITSQVPSDTFMFELKENGQMNILFMNRGTDAHHDNIKTDNDGNNLFNVFDELHAEDKVMFHNTMQAAYSTQNMISFHYRIFINNQISWRSMNAVPEKDAAGDVIWYGSTSDITPLVEYIASIEQIIFDIAHVIRRPLSSMIGLTKLIDENKLTEEEIIEISQKLHPISEEMEKFIRELNLVYNQKRNNAKFNIDISSLIDKRGSLFN